MVAQVHQQCISVMPRTPCSFQSLVCHKKPKVAPGLEEPTVSPALCSAPLHNALPVFWFLHFIQYTHNISESTVRIFNRLKEKNRMHFSFEPIRKMMCFLILALLVCWRNSSCFYHQEWKMRKADRDRGGGGGGGRGGGRGGFAAVWVGLR